MKFESADLQSLYYILMSNNVEQSIRENMSEILRIVPEISYCINFPQNHPHHHLDVWEHTLYALSQSKDDFTIRLALLLHDIGKPFTYQDDPDGVRHFYGHPEVSKTMSEKILNRLKAPENLKFTICYLIKNHDKSITIEEINENPSLQTIRLEMQRCDILAHNQIYNQKRLKYFEETSQLLSNININQNK